LPFATASRSASPSGGDERGKTSEKRSTSGFLGLIQVTAFTFGLL
jgi:hypothetical protein